MTLCSRYLNVIEKQVDQLQCNNDNGSNKNDGGLTIFSKVKRVLGTSKTCDLDIQKRK